MNISIYDEYLPYDIIYLISLYLPAGTFFINKEYYHIYSNDIWYENYLTHNYSNLKYQNQKSNFWKDLYKKHLKTGNIYILARNVTNIITLPIPGIAVASTYNSSLHLVLTFNGDLFEVSQHTYKFINSNVISITHDAYITYDKLYYIEDGKWILFTITNQLIKVKYWAGIFYALTSKMLYIIINQRNINTIPFKNATDLGIIGLYVSVLETDGNLYTIYPISEVKEWHIDEVKSINESLIIKLDKTSLINYSNIQSWKCPYPAEKIIELDKLIILHQGKLTLHRIVLDVCHHELKYIPLQDNRLTSSFNNHIKDFNYIGPTLYIIK